MAAMHDDWPRIAKPVASHLGPSPAMVGVVLSGVPGARLGNDDEGPTPFHPGSWAGRFMRS